MARAHFALLAALFCAGCWMSAHVDELLDRPVCDTLDTDAICKDIFGGSSSGEAGWSTGAIVTTTADPGGGSGGGAGSTGGSTGPGDPELPDEADAGLWASLSVSPTSVTAVMNVDVTLAWSGPVETVDLFDNNTPILLDVPPAAALHTLKVTSDQVPGDGTHHLRAVARAADGRSVQAHAELEIDVKSGGWEDWASPVPGELTAYTGAAMLGDDVVAVGYVLSEVIVDMKKVPAILLAVTVLDVENKGQPKFPPRVFEAITWSGESPGPAVAVDPGGAVYVTATVPFQDTTRSVLYKLDPGTLEPIDDPAYGLADEDATALALCQDHVVVAGSIRTDDNPKRYDMRVSWLSRETLDLAASRPWAAPISEDPPNFRSERAYGVACVGGEVVVAGTREIYDDDLQLDLVRTVVLRYATKNEDPKVWTSKGDPLPEDAGLAVAPTKDGGFAVVGWARLQFGTVRQALTLKFKPDGSLHWPRLEPTPGEDATGRAIAEDLEGKLIVAGSRFQAKKDLDAWIFAIPGKEGLRTWEELRNGSGNGPDEAYGLALDEWGYSHAVGGKIEGFEVRAFALRLYP
jgi:hypothetical protein